MNKAVNTYWVDARLAMQQPLTQSAPRRLQNAGNTVSLPATDHRSRARSRGALFSPYALFGMVILAMFALCITATMRTHAEMNTAAQTYQQANSEVLMLRNANASLETEVKRLRTDTRTIESAARTRLGMVRPNEIVVSVE